MQNTSGAYRSLKKFAIYALVLLFLLATVTACSNIDPNVKREEDEEGTYSVIFGQDGTDPDSVDGFVAYGSGKTGVKNLTGVDVDVSEFAIRSYELCFMLAQGNFDSPYDLSVDALAQYAFCRLFFDKLYEMPASGVLYREATLDQLKPKVEELFGVSDIDLTRSNLYTPGRGKFEMWQPNYGTNIYYHVDTANLSGSQLVIATTFYNEKTKSTLKGKTTVTVEIKDGHPIIRKLSSEV